MPEPLTIDVAHNLGRDEAKARIAGRIGEIDRMLPGGGTARAHWASEYRLELAVTAMGQNANVAIDIEDTRVRVSMILPPLLAMFGGAIKEAVRSKGKQLLLGSK
jgi:hypothetical protein